MEKEEVIADAVENHTAKDTKLPISLTVILTERHSRAWARRALLGQEQ